MSFYDSSRKVPVIFDTDNPLVGKVSGEVGVKKDRPKHVRAIGQILAPAWKVCDEALGLSSVAGKGYRIFSQTSSKRVCLIDDKNIACRAIMEAVETGDKVSYKLIAKGSIANIFSLEEMEEMVEKANAEAIRWAAARASPS